MTETHQPLLEESTQVQIQSLSTERQSITLPFTADLSKVIDRTQQELQSTHSDDDNGFLAEQLHTETSTHTNTDSEHNTIAQNTSYTNDETTLISDNQSIPMLTDTNQWYNNTELTQADFDILLDQTQNEYPSGAETAQTGFTLALPLTTPSLDFYTIARLLTPFTAINIRFINSNNTTYALADFFNHHDLVSCQYNLALLSFNNIRLTPSIFIAPFHEQCITSSPYQVHTTNADHEIALDTTYQLTSIKLPNTEAYLYQTSQVNPNPVQLQSDIYQRSQAIKAQCSNIAHNIKQQLTTKFDTPLTRLSAQPSITTHKESQTTLTTIHSYKQTLSAQPYHPPSPTNVPTSSTATSLQTPSIPKPIKTSPPLPSKPQVQQPQQQTKQTQRRTSLIINQVDIPFQSLTISSPPKQTNRPTSLMPTPQDQQPTQSQPTKSPSPKHSLKLKSQDFAQARKAYKNHIIRFVDTKSHKDMQFIHSLHIWFNEIPITNKAELQTAWQQLQFFTDKAIHSEQQAILNKLHYYYSQHPTELTPAISKQLAPSPFPLSSSSLSTTSRTLSSNTLTTSPPQSHKFTPSTSQSKQTTKTRHSLIEMPSTSSIDYLHIPMQTTRTITSTKDSYSFAVTRTLQPSSPQSDWTNQENIQPFDFNFTPNTVDQSIARIKSSFLPQNTSLLPNAPNSKTSIRKYTLEQLKHHFYIPTTTTRIKYPKHYSVELSIYPVLATDNSIPPKETYKDIHPNNNPKKPYIPHINQKYYYIKPWSETIKALPYNHFQTPQTKSPHPYEDEIKACTLHYKPHKPQTRPKPPKLDMTDVTNINTFELFSEMLTYLTHPYLAIDAEYDTSGSYAERIVLLQLTVNNHTYLINTQRVWSYMNHLQPTFANPDILKLFYSLPNDIRLLQNNFNLFVVNAFDIRILQEEHTDITGDLATFTEQTFFNHATNKPFIEYPRLKSNYGEHWEYTAVILNQQHQQYAAMDSFILKPLFDATLYDTNLTEEQFQRITLLSRHQSLAMYIAPKWFRRNTFETAFYTNSQTHSLSSLTTSDTDKDLLIIQRIIYDEREHLARSSNQRTKDILSARHMRALAEHYHKHRSIPPIENVRDAHTISAQWKLHHKFYLADILKQRLTESWSISLSPLHIKSESSANWLQRRYPDFNTNYLMLIQDLN